MDEGLELSLMNSREARVQAALRIQERENFRVGIERQLQHEAHREASHARGDAPVDDASASGDTQLSNENTPTETAASSTETNENLELPSTPKTPDFQAEPSPFRGILTERKDNVSGVTTPSAASFNPPSAQKPQSPFKHAEFVSPFKQAAQADPEDQLTCKQLIQASPGLKKLLKYRATSAPLPVAAYDSIRLKRRRRGLSPRYLSSKVLGVFHPLHEPAQSLLRSHSMEPAEPLSRSTSDAEDHFLSTIQCVHQRQSAGHWDTAQEIYDQAERRGLTGIRVEKYTCTAGSGYLLDMWRILREGCVDVTALLHGIADSSAGMVEQALDAYELQHDVFLLNNRSCVPAQHKVPGFAGYWNFSIGELAMEDLGAQLDTIDEIKRHELHGRPDKAPAQPYLLNLLAHSLGGGMALIYAAWRSFQLSTGASKQRVHATQLVLLGPAGFHNLQGLLQLGVRALAAPYRLLMGAVGIAQSASKTPGTKALANGGGAPTLPSCLAIPLHIPTQGGRHIAFGGLASLLQVPIFSGVVQGLLIGLLNGDRSAWPEAVIHEKYHEHGMPAVSLPVLLHIIQWALSGEFRLFDMGSPAANERLYGQAAPPCITDLYVHLRSLPIHLVAGGRDRIVFTHDVRKHATYLKAAGCHFTTFRNFPDLAHLDLTQSRDPQLKAYVSELLQRVLPPAALATKEA